MSAKQFHYRYVCQACGRTATVTVNGMWRLWAAVAPEGWNYAPDKYGIERSTCPDCQGKEGKT